MGMAMPKILSCSMTDCAYNNNDGCHALAITVGAETPMCDTFMMCSQKGGGAESNESVGACKVVKCNYNQSLECTASGIHISRHADHAECDTFAGS